MAVKYKLWLEIERIDDRRDTYENLEPREVAVRTSKKAAETLRRYILELVGEFAPLEGD